MKKIKRSITISIIILLMAYNAEPAIAQEQHSYLFYVRGQKNRACYKEAATINFKDSNGQTTWNLEYQNKGSAFSESEPVKAELGGTIPPSLKKTTEVELCVQQKNINSENVGENQCQTYPLSKNWYESSLEFNFDRSPIDSVPDEIANAQPSTEIEAGDLAEYSHSTQQLEGGDIVAIETTGKDRIIRTQQEYEPKVTGVISINPTVLLNRLGENNLPGSFFAVAGWGKVPTKVSNINGPINTGDHVSASSIPGTGMKTTQAGVTVGKALEPFIEEEAEACPDNPQYKCGQILVMVDVNWFDPLITLSSTGELVILEATYSGFLTSGTKAIVDENGFQLVNQENGEKINRVGVFAETVSAKIRAGLVTTINLIADSITVNKKLTAPEIEATKITADGATFTKINANSLSPQTEGGNITIDLENKGLESQSDFGKLIVKGDSEFTGNVGIGATLETQDLEVKNELVADSARIRKLQAETIEGLEDIVASLSAQYINNNISGLEDQISTFSSGLSLGDEIATDSGYLLSLIDTTSATDSAQLTESADSWTVTDPSGDVKLSGNLTVLGTTTLAQTIVSGPLTQDGTLLIDNGDSINVLGGTLYIQNHRMGGIDLLAGRVTIDVEGNAVFEGDLTVKGTLFANMIKPVNGDLVFDLSSPTASSSPEPNTYHPSPNTGFGKILVMGTDGEPVYSLDASGSAEFAGEVLASSFSINRPVIAAEPDFSGTIISTASAGVATIPAGKKEVTINSPYVNGKSLIYLTPIGSTANQVIYLARTNPETKTFTPAIDKILTKDILFSWWIVN